jgi:hypothetical protein
LSIDLKHNPELSAQTGKVLRWELIPFWSNNGSTPTRNMKVHTNCCTFDGEPPSDWEFPDLWDETIPTERRVDQLWQCNPGARLGVTNGIFPPSFWRG